MSTLFYNKLWAGAQSELNELIDEEKFLERPKIRIEKDHEEKLDFHTLAVMYLKYVRIMRTLDLCYDQVIHVQKRIVIRRLLDGIVGRTLEIRHEMVNSEMSEILSFDEVLIEMHLTHEQLEIPIPRYFRLDRMEELKSRNESIDEILIKNGLQEKSAKDGDDEVSTLEEAIILIQTMERSRQGKLKARFMREIHTKQQKDQQQQKGGRSTEHRQSPTPAQESLSMDPQAAALKIQKIWKGYITWKKIQLERQDEMIFLGMALPPKSVVDLDEIARIRVVENRRRQLQAQEARLYRASVDGVKRDILQKEGSEIVDEMQKDIRNWFFVYKERFGKFPDYPTVEQGGYNAVLTRRDELTSGDTKSKLKSKKSSGKTSPKNLAGRRLSTPRSPFDGDVPPPRKSTFLPEIVAATANYKDVWENRVLSGGVTEEPFDEEIIQTEKRREVNQELRVQVDALMRQELEHLKLALLKDKGKKGKKLRAALRKEQKKKKPRTAKKKRKEKDLTPHSTLESLFEELVKRGIVKKCTEVYLKEFLGEPSYLPANPDKKRDFIGTRFSQADVRRFVTEYCVLPLGCREAHLTAPLIKSVLLTGPICSGKTMLANAICTETGATMFDLTAANLVGKYPGREGLKMLMHLISKVGKLMQPSVILVEDAEKMFAKKIPKTDKTDPKRIKKCLQKLMKSFGVEDRILLVGTSRVPFECDMKGLTGTYNKIVCLPRPDHASRFALWRQLVDARGGHLVSSVDLSTLTKVSDGYTSGSIAAAIAQTLTPHRVALQKRNELQALEFIRPLAKCQPVYREEEQAMTEWYLRTPLVRKKIASLQPAEKRSTRAKKDAANKEDGINSKKKKSKSRKRQ